MVTILGIMTILASATTVWFWSQAGLYRTELRMERALRDHDLQRLDGLYARVQELKARLREAGDE